ncbi:MAG TPA: pyridoxamine 5'-phosphate oxidase family protein [Terriglobales bacterium]|nr:pyridoxamine 5'-phosphate oxidase family protein [Terriglobales bacterium]
MNEPARGFSTPRATRPYAPHYGIKAADEGSGLLPWSWAEERLERCRNFYLSTARADGRPHVMPIWGLWLDRKFFFSSGKESQKAKNLASNPNCALATGDADEAVIVEGTVTLVTDRDLLQRFETAVAAKYNFEMSGYAEEPVYVLAPEKAFGLVESDFVNSATRWTFRD